MASNLLKMMIARKMRVHWLYMGKISRTEVWKSWMYLLPKANSYHHTSYSETVSQITIKVYMFMTFIFSKRSTPQTTAWITHLLNLRHFKTAKSHRVYYVHTVNLLPNWQGEVPHWWDNRNGACKVNLPQAIREGSTNKHNYSLVLW